MKITDVEVILEQPQGPGLGIEINEATIEKYRVA